MHVLYVHRTAGDRVERVHIMGIVNALRELGHTVEISSPPGCDPERGPGTAASHSGPVEVRQGALRRTLKRGARKAPAVFFEFLELAYNAYAALDMLRRATHRTPDLIYERSTANSFVPTLMARLWGVPIVQEVNVTAEIGRLRPLVLRRLTLAIERWVARRADVVLTVSSEFKRLIERAGWPGERIYVLQNAIDPARFNPDTVQPAVRPPHLPSDGLVIGYVGAFVPYHGLGELVNVAGRLQDRHPQTCWLLVGDGVERPMIERMIEAAGLQERFWLPGRVPHDRVPEYVAAMDIAVLPNSETFNSPVKLFEYMAMGKAVIAPETPAISEVVRHGETGLLIAPNDAEALRTAVERLVADKALRDNLGAQARRCVLENHTWEKNAKRVLAALESTRSENRG